ncbi:AraC-type DNA-binding protein [bacterium A37T11]|nr:AraC-type DNA-binding protein [bacterium A37T11]
MHTHATYTKGLAPFGFSFTEPLFFQKPVGREFPAFVKRPLPFADGVLLKSAQRQLLAQYRPDLACPLGRLVMQQDSKCTMQVAFAEPGLYFLAMDEGSAKLHWEGQVLLRLGRRQCLVFQIGVGEFTLELTGDRCQAFYIHYPTQWLQDSATVYPELGSLICSLAQHPVHFEALPSLPYSAAIIAWLNKLYDASHPNVSLLDARLESDGDALLQTYLEQVVREHRKAFAMRRYLHQHLLGKIKVKPAEILALIYGRTPLSINRAFKAAFGCTSGEYLFRYQLRAARRLLFQKESVGTVAHLSGYSETGNFCKAYRNYYGHTPFRTTLYPYDPR